MQQHLEGTENAFSRKGRLKSSEKAEERLEQELLEKALAILRDPIKYQLCSITGIPRSTKNSHLILKDWAR